MSASPPWRLRVSFWCKGEETALVGRGRPWLPGVSTPPISTVRVLQSCAGLSFLCTDLIYLKILLYGCCPADKAEGQQ